MPTQFRFSATKLSEMFQRFVLWWMEKLNRLFGTDRAKRRLDEQDRTMKVLVLGPKASGKTTVALRLTTHKRKRVDCFRDTKGASGRCYTTYKTEYNGDEVKFCELSGDGDAQYHEYPPAYFYARVHAVVYVLDLHKPARFKWVKDDLERLMTHQFLRNKPFLIVGNKVDLLSWAQFRKIEKNIADCLNLRSLTLRTKTMTQTTLVSSINQMPANDLLPAGEWLLSEILKDFKELKARVREERAIYARDEFDKNAEIEWVEDDPIPAPAMLAMQAPHEGEGRQAISYKNRRRISVGSRSSDIELDAKMSSEMIPQPSEEGDKLNRNRNLDIKATLEYSISSESEGEDDQVEPHGTFDPTAPSEDFFNLNIPAITEYMETEIFEPAATKADLEKETPKKKKKVSFGLRSSKVKPVNEDPEVKGQSPSTSKQ